MGLICVLFVVVGLVSCCLLVFWGCCLLSCVSVCAKGDFCLRLLRVLFLGVVGVL